MSNLAHLLAAYRNHPAIKQIAQSLEDQTHAARIQLNGLHGAQESFVLAATTLHPLPSTLHLFISNSKEEAAYRHNDLEGLLEHRAVYFFPDSFKRPAFFDDLNPTQMLQRSELVSKVTGAPPGGEEGASHLALIRENNTLTTLSPPAGEPGGAVIVTYPEALFEKVVKPEILAKSRFEVRKGEELDVDFIIEVLVDYGFERTDFVYEPGQFSIRGGIVDLFSFGNDLPYRIELFDKEVETIRVFDPLTQLSQRNIASVSIVPNLNTRFRQDQKVSLFQVLPQNAVIWVKDFQFLLDRLQYCFERAEQFAAKLTALDPAELREIFRDRAFLFPGDVAGDVAEHPLVFLEKQGKTTTELIK